MDRLSAISCIAISTKALYPNFGYLYPEGTKELRKVFNDTTVRAALEPYSKYLQYFDQAKRLLSIWNGIRAYQGMSIRFSLGHV